jgi:DNA-binding NarL/FixJ family response regulator
VPEAVPDHLLIVEDHLLLATALAMALRQLGLAVETAAGPTAETILQRVRQLEPVLVLLDLELGSPLGSGLDLIGPLIGAGGQVVMMTGVNDHLRLAACVEAGAIGIVNKAAGFADLVDAIRRVAAGEELLTDGQRQVLLDELGTQRRADRVRLAPFATLSPREKAVLTSLLAGDSAETIAQRSYVSLATIRSQIRSILVKLGVKSQLAAVALARRANWSLPPE